MELKSPSVTKWMCHYSPSPAFNRWLPISNQQIGHWLDHVPGPALTDTSLPSPPPSRCACARIQTKTEIAEIYLKGATSRFAHLEKLSLNRCLQFCCLQFVLIFSVFKHPCFFLVIIPYPFGVRCYRNLISSVAVIRFSAGLYLAYGLVKSSKHCMTLEATTSDTTR